MNALAVPHPYYLSTAAQSRTIDAETIESFGIDGFTLMEMAGSSAARHLLKMHGAGQHGVVLCGKGNNAGDALVVARYLIQHGVRMTIVFLSGTDGLSKDTQKNHELLAKITDNDPGTAEIRTYATWTDFPQQLQADFVVDGMLGTGLSSELRGAYAAAVDWANHADVPIYAMDIPTGLHADSGRVLGCAVKATATFAFGMRKLGFYLNEGYFHTGQIIFCELPFPNYLKKSCNTFLLNDSWVKPAVIEPARHKYERGVLYLIAGSEGLTGAAMLAARSAWAEGLGAVTLICPHGILPIFETQLPQIIKKPVGGRNEFAFQPNHVSHVLDLIREKPGKVLLGPGLGRDPGTPAFVEAFVSQYIGDLLIDADGLWCLAQLESWEKPAGSNWILTPHPGEFALLTGESTGDGHVRLEHVRQFCQAQNVTVLSKGFPSIVGTQEGETYLTSYDTRTFSRAGFGDVLAGKVAAYWLLGNNTTASCALGLLNGRQKIEHLKKEHPGHLAEPTDLI
jgi:NAD(P)H-hydrate epimerase